MAIASYSRLSQRIAARCEQRACFGSRPRLSGQTRSSRSDFARIARRNGIENRDAAFKIASAVIASIASSVAAK
jgi:hypothetical protein